MDQQFFTNNITVKVYKKDEIIFREGEPSRDLMYFVFSGNLSISKNRKDQKEHQIGILKEKEFFGEMSLLNQTSRSSTVKVISEEARLGILDKATLLKLGSTNPGFVYNLLENSTERFLRIDSKIQQLVEAQATLSNQDENTSSEEIQKLRETIHDNNSKKRINPSINILDYINNLTTKFYKKGDLIFDENAMSDGKMYFILSGLIQIVKDFHGHPKEMRILEVGSFFGEMALISKQPRAAKAIVLSDEAKIGSLDQEQFIKIAKTNPQFLFTLLRAVLLRTADSEIIIDKLVIDISCGH